MSTPHALVWVDLEMTGLDSRTDKILEAGVIITDGQLKEVARMGPLFVHQPDAVLDSMDAWCKKTHGASGLTDRVRASTTSVDDVDRAIFEFLKQHVPEHEAHMAGWTIPQDKLFMVRHMPQTVSHLHYDLLDVAAFEEACARWAPALVPGIPRPRGLHSTIEDCEDAIAAMRYFKNMLFDSNGD